MVLLISTTTYLFRRHAVTGPCCKSVHWLAVLSIRTFESSMSLSIMPATWHNLYSPRGLLLADTPLFGADTDSTNPVLGFLYAFNHCKDPFQPLSLIYICILCAQRVLQPCHIVKEDAMTLMAVPHSQQFIRTIDRRSQQLAA